MKEVGNPTSFYVSNFLKYEIISIFRQLSYYMFEINRKSDKIDLLS